MSVGLLDVWIHVTQAGFRENLRPSASGQWSAVAGCDRNAGYVGRRLQRNHGVVRWILDHIEGHVAKVAFEGNSVTGAKTGLAVAKDVPREADSGRPVILGRLPQRTDLATRRQLNGAGSDLIENRGAGAVVVIGIQLGIFIVLDTVVLVADSQGHGEPWQHFPRILRV